MGRNYNDEDVIRECSQVRSMSQLLKRLGLKPSGGNYANMRKTLQRLNLSCDHWHGQAWNKNKRLKDWSEYSRVAYLKKHLIKERGHKCEECGLCEWRGYPIVLEVDHIDGDRSNNSFDNLRLLCCNCHALTDTWRGRKKQSR